MMKNGMNETPSLCHILSTLLLIIARCPPFPTPGRFLTSGGDRGYNAANQEDVKPMFQPKLFQSKQPAARHRALLLLASTLAGTLIVTVLPAGAQTSAPAGSGQPNKTTQAAKLAGNSGAAAGTALTYRFQPGETHRYKIKAFFDGHFPPFAQPGSLPIHLMAELVYVTKVNKQTPAGTEVTFSVDSADITLLTHEVTVDEKIDANDQTPFPVALADVQQSLNTTAVIRPDGSVASVANGVGNPVRVNIGFDLRKLFLLVMPITFPKKPVHAGDSWPAQEGVLGVKPGSTSYTNNLVSILPNGNGTDYSLSQDASSRIDDTLDEAGNSTNNADKIFSTLKGDVTLDGKVTFTTPANSRVGQMVRGMLHMQVNLQRKVTKKDAPKEIVAATDGDYDVKARLVFRNNDAPAKAQPKSKKPGGNIAQQPAPPAKGGGGQ
jgi:hypothetical protein